MRSESEQAGVTMEGLEQRQLFAVTIAMPAAGVLSFTGDWQADRVSIKDNGAGVISGAVSNAAGVMVGFGPVAGIHRVQISLAGNNDSVDYTVYGDMVSGTNHDISAYLGEGNDTFRYYAGNDIDMGAADFQQIYVAGEYGNDYIYAFHRGEVDGTMYQIFDGGWGDDRIITDEKFDAGSAGYFYHRSYGQGDKDTIDLLVRKSVAADPIIINAVASGGSTGVNWDVLTRTPLAGNDATFEVLAVVV
jgi:hypothetical protein